MKKSEMLYKHYCYEWDMLLIDESCPEFECCICFNLSAKEKQEIMKEHEND